MNRFTDDLRYAVRQLTKSPGFTTVAVVTLALGIGANSAIFSVIDAVLLRPLPYAEPGRLVTIDHFYPSLNNLKAGVSPPGFRDYAGQTQLFSVSAVETNWVPSLTRRGDPTRVFGGQVSGRHFEMLGVAPALGRVIRPDETTAGHEKVVVLSDGFWKRVFGGRADAVGQLVVLNGESYEVVGVMPPSFRDEWSRQAEFWVPLVLPDSLFADSRRGNEFLVFTGRLKPGVTVDQAQADLHALATRLKKDHPNSYSPDWDLLLATVADRTSGPLRTSLFLLLGAVGFVLLIACANVANLQLARAAARSREIAVRLALGASSRDLLRLLLTESVVLSLVGGAVGLLLALWGVPALVAINANGLPTGSEVGLDARVLGYTLLLSVGTGVLFGLAPALQLARTNLQSTLKEGGRGSAGDRAGQRLRRGLVIGTVSLALTLLAGAGLLIRSFAAVSGVNPGFQPDHLLTLNVSLPSARYTSDAADLAFFDRLIPAVSAVPGVTSVAGTSVMPFTNNWSTSSFNVEGYTSPKGAPGPWGDVRLVTPGFQATLGIPLIKGRFLNAQDILAAPAVAVVDQDLADRYWKNEDPIGKRITYDDPEHDSTVKWIQVVGVVGHAMHEGLDAQHRVQVYLPEAQVTYSSLDLAIRTTGDPMAVAGSVRAAINALDPDLPVTNVRSMEQLIEASTGQRRFAMLLLGIFSGIALLLASVGLYGVMSYTVTQRASELGVRMALGAGARDVLRLVLNQGMRLAFFGVGIGLVAAFAVTRLLRSMLFGVSATDPLTYVGISLLLLAVTLVACWLPARRATRVDPVVVLRAD
ncbi:MAG: ABC transporter permease [Gemmatimonadales bacterium]